MKSKGSFYCCLYALSVLSITCVFIGITVETFQINTIDLAKIYFVSENVELKNDKTEIKEDRSTSIEEDSSFNVCYDNNKALFSKFNINDINNGQKSDNESNCGLYSYAGIVVLSIIYNSIINNKKFMKFGTM